MQDFSSPCEYSIRLMNKLKALDKKGELDYALIDKAIYWARKYHGTQIRKSGHPFYYHPLEVAYKVADHKLTTNMIVASILHDIVEDTDVTFGMILDDFGERIKQMVDRLTRDRPGGITLSVKEIFMNASENDDKEVILIKLFDRLHNMETIEYMSPEKRIQTSIETISEVIGYAYDMELVQALLIISAEYALPEKVEELKRLYS